MAANALWITTHTVWHTLGMIQQEIVINQEQQNDAVNIVTELLLLLFDDYFLVVLWQLQPMYSCECANCSPETRQLQCMQVCTQIAKHDVQQRPWQ